MLIFTEINLVLTISIVNAQLTVNQKFPVMLNESLFLLKIILFPDSLYVNSKLIYNKNEIIE